MQSKMHQRVDCIILQYDIKRYRRTKTDILEDIAMLVVLLEKRVLECEAGNSATSQSGKEVDPNLSTDLNGRGQRRRHRASNTW